MKTITPLYKNELGHYHEVVECETCNMQFDTSYYRHCPSGCPDVARPAWELISRAVKEFGSIAFGQYWIVLNDDEPGTQWLYRVLAIAKSQDDQTAPVAICVKCDFDTMEMVGAAMCFDLTTGFDLEFEDWYLSERQPKGTTQSS